jgi:DNA-binding response OmpR family regulator
MITFKIVNIGNMDKMKILLVEDEERITQFIKKGLREEGYAVDSAEDGQKALTLVQVYEYDLIITDIMMPNIDGIEFIRQVRELHNSIPILILSAKTSTEDKINGLDIGADDYLPKPFAFNELLARLRALLRRQSNYTETLEFADLKLNPAQHTASKAGEKLDLTQKEFALLEFLMRNKNRVVTRTSIIEHVWDMHFDSNTNLVDVFVSYLRKKIEKGGSDSMIYSVRGVGYTLKLPENYDIKKKN